MFKNKLAGTALSAVVSIAGFGLVGCSSNDYEPSANSTQLAARAARTEYPQNLDVTDELKASATVNRMNGDITIRNFSSKAIADFNVWVNKAYLLRVSNIDPNGAVVLHRDNFFNSAGNSLEKVQPSAITVVQIQSGGKLYSIQGPQME